MFVVLFGGTILKVLVMTQYDRTSSTLSIIRKIVRMLIHSKCGMDCGSLRDVPPLVLSRDAHCSHNIMHLRSEYCPILEP